MADAQPLNKQIPIIDPVSGCPTDYFIKWAQQFNNSALGEIFAGAGIDISAGPTIAADQQAILDAIDNTQGSILYRDADEWKALAPGTAGHFLKTNGVAANPEWAAAGGGGGGGIGCYGTVPGTGGNSTSAFATKGRLFTPLYSGSVEGVAFNFSAVSGATYIATVCEMSGTNIVSVLAQSSPWVAGASGQVYRPFSLSASFLAGLRYAVMLTRTDSTSTYALPIAQATAGSFSWSGCPFTDFSNLTLASTNPISGSVNTATAAFSGDVLMTLTP
jgi:hypothetical protein